MWAAMGLKSHFTVDAERKNVRQGQDVGAKQKSGTDIEAEQRLQQFFAPFNRKLFNLIGRELPWSK